MYFLLLLAAAEVALNNSLAETATTQTYSFNTRGSGIRNMKLKQKVTCFYKGYRITYIKACFFSAQ